MSRRQQTAIRVLAAAVATLAAILLRFSDEPHMTVTAEPHPHRGKVKPFIAGTPGVSLSPQALAILQAGEPYQTQVEGIHQYRGAGGGRAMVSAKSGRGVVVQDVNAPVDVVWSTILNFDHYKDMVPKTVESEVYFRGPLHSDNRFARRMMSGRRRSGSFSALEPERIRVRMKVGFPLLTLQFFVDHMFDPDNNSLTWTLDYNHKSDLDDSVGYWHVVPHPNNPEGASRVYYSVDIRLYNWIPSVVVDFMKKQALTDATAWVKKYSELAYESGLDNIQQPRTLKIAASPLSRERYDYDDPSMRDRNDSNRRRSDDYSLARGTSRRDMGRLGNEDRFITDRENRRGMDDRYLEDRDGVGRRGTGGLMDDRYAMVTDRRQHQMDGDSRWWRRNGGTQRGSSSWATTTMLEHGDEDLVATDRSVSGNWNSNRRGYSTSFDRNSAYSSTLGGGSDTVLSSSSSYFSSPSRTAFGGSYSADDTGRNTRLILVSSVFALSLYNIHLYFSH
jgi:Polyketide cyclase / dehydrase and lipid transport